MHSQLQFFKTHWKHRYCHGGILRRSRKGRGARPLSGKDPLHLVLKANRRTLRSAATYATIRQTTKRYAQRFFVKIEQISVQQDHVHLLIRCSKRSLYKKFFRVLAGQIAQSVTHTYRRKREGQRFWKYRPFTRVIKGWKPYLLVKDYIQLNEKEVTKQIPYQKKRLKGLTPEQLQSLWE